MHGSRRPYPCSCSRAFSGAGSARKRATDPRAARRRCSWWTTADRAGDGHYVERGLEQAAERGSALVVLEMDTPGGLDTSMRDIIQAILASPVPVATFVAPSGARAASAGTYILYASHVAAMAPATNLGAATPVADRRRRVRAADRQPQRAARRRDAGRPRSSDERRPHAPSRTAMERKAINDAVAYIRSLAQLRGRNVEWAEKAVREAASLSAREALDAARDRPDRADVDDLLAQARRPRGRRSRGARAHARRPRARSSSASSPTGARGCSRVITDPERRATS